MNYGSPFCKQSKVQEKRPALDSIDLVGIVLWFLKSKDFAYRMCPVFGIVPVTLIVWLKYALYVIFKAVTGT